MLKKITALALCGPILLALGLPGARRALAAPAGVTFNVNSTLDEVDDNPGNGTCHSSTNHCSLRAAVMEANFSSGAGATIIVPSGIYTLTIPAGVGDDASNGDLNLTSPPDTFLNAPATSPSIQLQGAGAAKTIINAQQLDRVLTIETNRIAAVSGVTLQGGYLANGYGGGLFNAGTLTVTNSTIKGNQAVTDGYGAGGAYNFGNLTLIESTIAGNSAVYKGGGLYNAGTLLVVRSTIDDNHAEFAGGIMNEGGRSLILVNSTVSGNYALTDGGGIFNYGEINMYSTTLVGNWADSDRQGGVGGGVYNHSLGTFNLLNSLVVGNNLGDQPEWNDCYGTLHAYGTDIVGLEGDPAACTIDQPAGGNLYLLNSLNFLSGLQDNGGPTWTIALRAGSSAIMDGGNPVTCTDENTQLLATDQRGAARVVGGNCDIGAYEFLPPAAFLPFIRR